MNLIYTFILILTVSFSSLAQSAYELDHHMEIGFGAGVYNYTGDLAQKIRYNNLGPGVQFFYRHNDRKEVSVYRINMLVGQIKGNNTLVVPNEPLQTLSFSETNIEIAALYEYNFFNYRDIKNVYFMSPYLFGGVALSIFMGNGVTPAFTIPFGVGVKYKLSDNWNLGMEYGARKTFTDNIDSVNDDQYYSSSTPSDWYYFLGLNLSYTFYQQRCPECSPKDF